MDTYIDMVPTLAGIVLGHRPPRTSSGLRAPRFYHEAGKVNFVDPPAMASAVVSREPARACAGEGVAADGVESGRWCGLKHVETIGMVVEGA